MKKFALGLALVVLALPSFALSANVRISQVYGDGGSTATSPPPAFNQDFVELYNAGNSPVDISGWALEYGSVSGTWGIIADNYYVFPPGSVIPPCSYVLIGGKWLSTYTGAALPTVDHLANFSASNSSGKSGLFTALQLNVACGAETPGALVDKVSFGPSTNCAEGTPVGTLSTLTAAIRYQDGFVDTGNNATDFSIGTPTPRNSASPINDICGLPVSAEVQSFGAMKARFR